MKVKSEKTVFIKDISQYEGQIVELQGWVMNKRTGKGIVFIILRDGTGFIQCVLTQETLNADDFNKANDLGLESSVYLKGTVVKDERQMGGYEMQVQDIYIYQDVKEYPISKKEHGVEFLMDHRHLWLRSKRQWAVMKVRNQIIF